ncbi:MAG TPA: hypothetical protein VK859_01990 [bacterium]|nr:hypothetical protein [bacterium]
MENPEVQFRRHPGDWNASIAMLLVPIPFFWLFYPHGGLDSGHKALVYLLCFDLFLFLYGFYRTLVIPHALQFQKDESLLVKSVLFPKTIPIHDWQSVRITEEAGQKGKIGVLYEIILRDGDSITLPSLTNMAVFMGRLALKYPQIEIKDERFHKENY